MSQWMTWSTYNSLNSTLVDIREQQFSSTDPLKIEDLRRGLLLVVQHCSTTTVILDLSRVRFYGARLIGMLVEISVALRESGKRLIVCGDTCGFIRACKLNCLFPLLPTFAEALNSLRGNCSVSPD